MAAHRDRERSGHGQAGDEDHQRVRQAGGECVAPAEPHELGVGRADAGERVLLAPKGDELGRAAQELDQLGGQLPAGRRLPVSGGAAAAQADERHEPRRPRADRSARISPAAGRSAAATPTHAAPVTAAITGGPTPRR